MSLHQIEDQQFKVLLDYLGLRGVVQHAYESTIIPVISIGTLPHISEVIDSNANIAVGSSVYTVPARETWELIQWSGAIAQSGATIAPNLMVTTVGPSGADNLWHPYYRQGGGTQQLSNIFTLNSVERFVVDFIKPMLLGSGCSLLFFPIAGDGTLNVQQNAQLLIRRYGENLMRYL